MTPPADLKTRIIAALRHPNPDIVTKAVAERFRELYPNGRPGAPLSPQD